MIGSMRGIDMNVGLLVLAVLFATIAFLQPIYLKRKHDKQMQDLKDNLRRLKKECDEATARANKYEEDFQKELTRISILLSKVI